MKETLRTLFQQKFNPKDYRKTVLENLLHAQQLLNEPQFLEETNDGDRIYGLGYLIDADGKQIGLYYTDVVSSDVRRKRVGFRQMMKSYVKYGADAAIAVFSDKEHWRLSYMSDLKGGETSAKRFSYILGDPNGQYNTPVNRLALLGTQAPRLRLKDIFEAFSVETLSKEFFDKYHQHYDRIVGELAKQGKSGSQYHDYVKKMMGRIIFLHFLQKKGWLNGNQYFLRDLYFMSPYQADFLEQVLEPLFFGIFNTETTQRERLFTDEHWDKKLLEEWKSLPYLNGGLFERDEDDKLHIKLPASLFEDLFTFLASYNFTVDENDPDDAEVGVDPEMLGKIFESLLEDNKAKGAFYTPKEIVRYMCKESLIAYLDSKFQPSDITDNVPKGNNLNNPTQESGKLSQCGDSNNREKCVSETRDLKSSIRAFVETHEMQPELETYRDNLDTALRNVKICDPAIGSGAFPMGLLNELWRCREALMDASDTSERCDFSNTVQAKRSAVTSTESPLRAGGTRPQSRVDLKKEIIENNIYGVDIERGAIDIARLRFWLSIVVDAEEPESLPNFDYKFMQGNSLIESYKGIDLSRISNRLRGGQSKSTQLLLGLDSELSRKNLQRLMRDYFSVTDHKQKSSMRQAINDEVKRLITDFIGGTASDLDTLDPSANQDFFLWHTWFKDIFDNGGFDIVIGNPPYGAKLSQEHKNLFKNLYNSAKTIKGKQKGSLDTYVLFLELGYNMLANNGQLAFIVPMPITSNDSVSGIHNILLSNCEPISISSYAVRPKPVFKNAVVNSSIIMFTKSMQRCRTLLTTQMYRRGENFNLQYLVDHLEFINSRQFVRTGRIAKISKPIESQILSKLFKATPIGDLLANNGLPVYYRTVGGRYFKVVTNYTTYSNKESSFNVKSEWRNVVACALSSSLAFWFYQVYSNNLSWSTYDIFDFTIPVKEITSKQKTQIEELYKRYVNDIEKNVNTRNVSVESKYTMDVFKEYKIVRSKAIIDEIDDYIGPLYGLTQEEIDFIKNYELEFRMAGE